MFIPAPAQVLQLPLTQKLEASPVVPVSAVPGVAEESQFLDSRVALQWTQPVFAGAEGQAGRSALTSSLPGTLLESPRPAASGYEPQGADPDALKSRDVHPLLAQGLSTWLSGVLAKPSSAANASGMAILMAKASEKIEAMYTGMSTFNDHTSTSSEVMNQLKTIYQSIAASDVFAAQRLNEAWMPIRLLANNKSSSEAAKNSDLEAFHQLAQPLPEPNAAQLTQWVSALEPDSNAAEQAARMLSQGNMVWQTELAPGLPLRIVREDAWRNHPQQSGQLEKGAMLKVEINLPNLGQLRITGSQWGQDISLHISHGKLGRNGEVNWTSLAQELLQELKMQGVTDVRVDPLPNAPLNLAAEEAPNV